MTEIVVPPHSAGPPLHTHDFDEAFYMLEGELIFQVEDALHQGAPASSLSLRATSPTRWPTTATRPRATCSSARPAGFERHWARTAAEAAGVEPPEWALQPIPEVTVVGPQIAAEV